MFNSSNIELDQAALEANLAYIRQKLGSEVRLSSVVKGNAYGHGIFEFIPMAEAAGIDHFAVFSADEALEVANISMNNSTIMIMGFIDNEELEWAIVNGIEFFVFEQDRLQEAIRVARKFNTKAKIHIEVETGLNRTGFDEDELQEVVDLINKSGDYLEVVGDCTHYAGAESVANYLRVTNQIRRFNKIDSWLRKQNIHPKIKHTACSAAAMSYPASRMQMVRIGILQYGFWPSRETFIDCIKAEKNRIDPLKRIISWKSKVMDVKEVKTGEFVGYGTTFMAPDNMKVATVPVGYSHGYSRALSNQGRVLIRGKRLAVIGIINMNLLMVDISECPEVAKGDEVMLIGDQDDQTVSVASFSELSNQLNYELLTRLPRNIPRTVINKKKLETKTPENGLSKA